jgi:tetratricopeptide (TPR) repeat protein
VGLKEEAERMFKKGLNLKIYHPELNYNFLNCHLLKEEYMMAENLIQRFEAFMGKSALLYEKRALLNFKMNRLTLALFDIESAISLDRNQADALYLKALIYLREEDFQAAISAMLDAARVCPRYTGLAFFLAIDAPQRASQAKVDVPVAFEPDDDLLGLLQCGLARRFDKIKDYLMSIVERGMERIDERKPGAASPGAEAQPAGAEAASAGGPDPARPVAGAAQSAAPEGAARDDSPESLLEALSEIALAAEDDLT